MPSSNLPPLLTSLFVGLAHWLDQRTVARVPLLLCGIARRGGPRPGPAEGVSARSVARGDHRASGGAARRGDSGHWPTPVGAGRSGAALAPSSSLALPPSDLSIEG